MRVDKSVINTINKQNIINIIRNNSPIFKAEIVRMTGLSMPTVMKITDELIAKKIVVETGKGESSGGKPPQLLEFNPASYYIIGIDVASTGIMTVIMDLAASIIYRDTAAIKIDSTPEEVIGRMINSIKNVMENSGVKKDDILGIGIGMPALVDKEEGKVLFAPDWNWENVDIAAPIQEEFKMDVVIDNVCRAYAMGEKWFGLGRNIENFLCIFLGYGIGSAVVLNNELYSGCSGSAGEIGHMTLEKNGPLCDCGNYGCLEALASSYAITRKARFFIERGEKSSILELAGGNIDLIEAKTVFDAAKEGDSLSLEIIREATEYIGIAIASIINFLDPELIILEGQVAHVGEILTSNIQKVVDRRQLRHAGRRVKIVVSQLGKNAAAIGAAAFIIKRFIETGGNKIL